MREATEEYRMNSDPFAAWFANCIELEHAGREGATRLFDSYRGWCSGGGFAAMSQQAFGRQLSENGLHRKKSSGIVWEGGTLNEAGLIALRQHEDSQYPATYGDGE